MNNLRVFALVGGLAAAGPALAMTLASPDLKNDAPIPKAQIYTACGGQNASPTLKWSGAPAATKSYVLTMIDVSVKPHDWSHWIVGRIMPSIHGVPGGGPTVLPPGAQAIKSNMGDRGYNGPCPPKGSGAHRYEVTIWAMPTAAVKIADDAHADEVRAMLAKSSLAHATIVGTAETR